MKISVVIGRVEKQKTGAVIIPVFEGEKLTRSAARADELLGGILNRLISKGDFKPKIGSTSLVYSAGKLAPERVILVGLGKKKDLSPDRIRQAAGRAAAYARANGAQAVLFLLEGLELDLRELSQAIAEGAALGLYRFTRFKSGNENGPGKDIQTLTLLTDNAGSVVALKKGVRIGEVTASVAAMVRDMVNAPPAYMTPTIMAAKAKEVARLGKLTIHVLDRPQMEKREMGALLAVAAGSSQPAKFIVLEYRRGGKKPFIALVGKAITFDSGGISLKPAENMDRMKDDMAGGAAVIGAILAASRLDLPLNIVALIPATENMPGSRAFKPGDVLRTMSGRTIEIISTDAEGRLILADALTYACTYKPAVIVDIATLTGACRIALGREAIGMLGNNAGYKQLMRDAGEFTGERVWELPLWETYYEGIKSDIADMKNAGSRDAGVITAAALLSKFVEER